MSKNTDVDLTKVQLNWSTDILKRIDGVLNSKNSDKDKVEMVRWLVKQALKTERED
jgi:hypothetical protein